MEETDKGKEVTVSGELTEEDRIQEIGKLHGEIQTAVQMSLEKAIRVGELLAEQKKKLAHGEWTPWVEANLPFSRPSASIYMKLFLNRAKLLEAHVFTIESARKLLVVPEKQEEKIREKELLEEEGLKKHMDSIAARIEDGSIDVAVGSKVARAVKKVHKERAEIFFTDDRSFLSKLADRIVRDGTDLRYVVDGNYEKAPDDAIHLKGIKMGAPAWIYMFMKLGIVVRKVYDFLMGGKELIDYHGHEEDVIDLHVK